MPAFTAILVPVIILIVSAFVIWLLDKIKSRIAFWEPISKWTFVPVIIFLVMSLIDFGKIHGIHFKDHNNDIFSRKQYEARTALIASIPFRKDEKNILFLEDNQAVYHEPILWMFYHNNLVVYQQTYVSVDLNHWRLKHYNIYSFKNNSLVKLKGTQ